MNDRSTTTDPLDDLGRFVGFRSDVPDATPDARDRAWRALVTEIERERTVGAPAMRPPRSRRPLAAAGGVAAAIAVIIVVGVAGWPSGGPRTLDVLAQARAALAPRGRIVHYRAVVSSSGGSRPAGVMERTEGWVLGRPDRRTEGRELTRYTSPGSKPSEPHYAETSWRPDTANPGRTEVRRRGGTLPTPTGPARRYVVGSARPTGSVFAHRLDPRDDGSWNLVREAGDETVLEQRAVGGRRVLVLDRRTHLPRRFTNEVVQADGRRWSVNTTISAESLPVDARTRALLSIDAPAVTPTPSWGTAEATRLIDRARARLTPTDGLTTTTFSSDRTTERFDTRTGRRTMRYRERRRNEGAFEFRGGLLRRGRLTPIHPGGTLGPQTTWTTYPRDADRVLVRTGNHRGIPVGRPSALPITIDALEARRDGWRVSRRTGRTVVLKTSPRPRYADAELVLDRRTGAILRGRTTSTPRLRAEHLRYDLDLVEALTTRHRPLRPGDDALLAPRTRR